MTKKKKSKTRRLLLILISLVILVVILGLVGSQFLGDRSSGVTVETAKVEIRTVTQTVTASGRIQPEVEIAISPDVSGEIIQLPVIEGQQVEQGQLLARIKPDFYLAQVEAAEANVLQARAFQSQRRADLLNAKQRLERQHSLYEREVISESVFQEAETAHEISKAALEAADYSVQSSEAILRESKEQLSKTVLYSPMGGTVSKLDVELGERVVGTTQMAGTEMMVIARLDQMELEVEVNENDVVNVALADSATIEIDAYPDRIFKGVVTEIANSARLLAGSSQQQVTNFPVKIRILDPHNAEARRAAGRASALAEESPTSNDYPSFRPGMSGTVDVFTQTVDQVTAVPIQAVTVRDFNRVKAQRSEADTTSVEEEETETQPMLRNEDLRKVIFMVDEESKARMIEVETGIADDRFMVIRSTLVGGEKVIIGPYSTVSRTLRPDATVKERQ